MKISLKHNPVSRSVYLAVSLAVSAYFFMLAVDALTGFVKVRSGVASVTGLFMIVIFSIIELGFIIFTAESYLAVGRRKNPVMRFLPTMAVYGWLYALLPIFRLWTLLPDPGDWGTYYTSILKTGDHVRFICGIAVGVVGIVLSVIIGKRHRPQTA